MKRHIILITLGAMLGFFINPSQTDKFALAIMAITVTGILGTFAHPFRSFDQSEKWQLFVMKSCVSPFFGLYGVIFVRGGSFLALSVAVTAAALHLAYWESSPQSREYSFNNFVAGHKNSLPQTILVLTRLRHFREHSLADGLISRIAEEDFEGSLDILQRAVKVMPKLEKHRAKASAELIDWFG